MSDLLAEEGIKEEWVVIWFEPDGDRSKKFKSEEKAREHASKEDVAEWNPLLEHRITTVIAELVPL